MKIELKCPVCKEVIKYETEEEIEIIDYEEDWECNPIEFECPKCFKLITIHCY